MNCQSLSSGKNRKNVLICRLLKILPRMLGVKLTDVFYAITAGSNNKDSFNWGQKSIERKNIN